MNDTRDDVGPEHNAKHKLTEWLQDHGATVWWEESNPWGYDQFTIRRDATHGGIPDLLIEIDGYAFVTEFKPGNSVGGIYDALTQLHGYWVEYLTKDLSYIVADRNPTIDGFLTASKHSRFGRLFPPYAEGPKVTLETMDDSRASCYNYGQLPPTEYRMTEQHIRTLWRLGKKTVGNIETVSHIPNLGTLLSEHLETEQLDPAPAVLWNKGKTNQDWKVLSK